MNDAIDWNHAAVRAAQVTKAGPPVDRPGLRALVGSLHASAADAPGYVADITGLTQAAQIAAEGSVLVVDRPRWSQAVTETFRAMVGDSLPEPRMPGAAVMMGEQLGWVLSLLSTRVLGQFDPYVSSAPGTGRLLLVAPNILTVQRQLDADPDDFHLWVCLHEQTHAVQFAAAPWLAPHLSESLQSVVRAQAAGLDRDEDSMAGIGEGEAPAGSQDVGVLPGTDEASGGEPVLARLLNAMRTAATPDAPEGQVPGVLSAVLPEEQRGVLAQAIATMSLLEGHADVVMDEVGPRAVPTVRSIRESFEKRRDERTLSTLVLRRLLGLDAKLLQYRHGAQFVRAVREQVGHSGLNAVWIGAENLPTPEEIAEPDLWVRRVHG